MNNIKLENLNDLDETKLNNNTVICFVISDDKSIQFLSTCVNKLNLKNVFTSNDAGILLRQINREICNLEEMSSKEYFVGGV